MKVGKCFLPIIYSTAASTHSFQHAFRFCRGLSRNTTQSRIQAILVRALQGDKPTGELFVKVEGGGNLSGEEEDRSRWETRMCVRFNTRHSEALGIWANLL